MSLLPVDVDLCRTGGTVDESSSVSSYSLLQDLAECQKVIATCASSS